MEQFDITGMGCAACQARVEKAVNAVEGVTSCTVSLLTNSMTVEGSADEQEIINAVTEAGYGIKKKINIADSLVDRETPTMLKRLVASVVLLVPLMLVPWVALKALLAFFVMLINHKFFVNGIKGVVNKAPNMDTLVALGSTASFLYGYFDSAAMILTLITVGKLLEARSKGKTTDALKSLVNLAPKTALKLVNGEELEVLVGELKVGDEFVVKAGGSIPVDGIVISGEGAVDESALTGESIPVDKLVGDEVFAATINQSGYLVCRATKVGEDTGLSSVIRLVSEAAATKAPIAKVADEVSGFFVPVVIGIAFVTFVIWALSGAETGFALSRAVSVLVISCPCALGLATPVAIVVGNGVAAKSGILFKNAVSLEELGKVSIVALDKTGTITKGEPTVTEIVCAEGVSDDLLLTYAYAVENKSGHPLAKAVVDEARRRRLPLWDADEFEVIAGNGVKAVVDEKQIFAGSHRYITSQIELDEEPEIAAEKVEANGNTPLIFIRGGEFLGIIGVADVMKEDSPAAVAALKEMGIKVVMITGDNEAAARAMGQAAGVDEIFAGVLPEGKEEVVKELKKQGMVAMTGDGINDAVALTSAEIGVAIGAGCDVAIDAADVVLMKSSLMDLATAIKLSRATLKNIHENLFWAFFYNVIGIPLAAGLLIPFFGIELNPVFAAGAMSLSSFCVVMNALRLNLFKK